MKSFFDFLAQFWRQLRPWTVINPWEQALRVRLGRHVRRLPPGVHLKVPLIDTIYAQSVRRRIVALQVQTITTTDGKAVSFAASLGYEIGDLAKLYETLHHAEDTIIRLGMAALAHVVRTRAADDCDQESIERAAVTRLDLVRFGIQGVELYLTAFAVVRTYRLISDPTYDTGGDQLSTTQEHMA